MSIEVLPEGHRPDRMARWRWTMNEQDATTETHTWYICLLRRVSVVMSEGTEDPEQECKRAYNREKQTYIPSLSSWQAMRLFQLQETSVGHPRDAWYNRQTRTFSLTACWQAGPLHCAKFHTEKTSKYDKVCMDVRVPYCRRRLR